MEAFGWPDPSCKGGVTDNDAETLVTAALPSMKVLGGAADNRSMEPQRPLSAVERARLRWWTDTAPSIERVLSLPQPLLQRIGTWLGAPVRGTYTPPRHEEPTRAFDLRGTIEDAMTLASRVCCEDRAVPVYLADDVPVRLIGDVTRLHQVVSALLAHDPTGSYARPERVDVDVVFARDPMVLTFRVTWGDESTVTTDDGQALAPSSTRFDDPILESCRIALRYAGGGIGRGRSRNGHTEVWFTMPMTRRSALAA